MTNDQEVLPPEKVDGNLVRRAVALDEKVVLASEDVGARFVVLGKLLLKMRDSGLWKYLQDTEGKPLYKKYESYTDARVGKMARSRVFELISVAQLEEGSKPIEREVIEELGVKKSAEIARLPEAKRTKAVIDKALKAESGAEVREIVREILNEELPASEKKEATVLFARQLPVKTVALLDSIEARGMWMEGIRDADRTLTQKQKFWHAVGVFFRDAHEQELAEADVYKKEFDRQEKERVKTEEANREVEKAARAQERTEKIAARKAEREAKRAEKAAAKKSAKKTTKAKAKKGKRRLVQIDAA